ncbi:MAG: hypothetical protein PHS24_01665 [Bacilli bacterium]|nr:hypothetical protein [Bacilli bacterium]
MILKGYNHNTLNNQKRSLHEYLNEYGVNLNHKDKIDVFKQAHKPKNCIKFKEKK